MKSINEVKGKNSGITLIALVITIIVLLILAGTSIAMLTGDNGILTQAQRAKLSTELAGYKEELDLYKLEKQAEDSNFLDGSLTAGKTNLSYNTKPESETGNIKTVITNISDEYFEKLEIIKGELLINTKDKAEIKVAQSLGIAVNPYDITDEGELLSSYGNLLLMDDNGTVTIPDSVTKIGEGAFANLEGLKTIIIPGSVKEISTNAFAFNTTLEKVIIQEGCEIIGNNAFQDCRNLKEISLPNSVIKIGVQAFYGCTNLKEITIPPKVERIESYTFAGDISLEKVLLNEGVKYIGYYAFEKTIFQEITLPSTLEQISTNAFNNNEKLNNIVVKQGAPLVYENGMLMSKDKSNIYFVSIPYINESTTFEIPEGIVEFSVSLARTRIQKLIIPSTLQTIGNATYFPQTLEEIEVSPKNTKFAVSNEDKILYTKDTKELIMCYSKEENINIDENEAIGILKINQYSMQLASNAKNVTFPNSAITIEGQIFGWSFNIETVKIGKNASNIEPVFAYTNYNVKVTIDPSNNYYTVENGILYNKEKTKLITVFYQIEGNFDIPSTVEEIGDRAFHGQEKMTSINIPTSVKKIGNSFNYCTFTEITIPSSVESIGETAFSQNSNLSKIKINKKENSISRAPWGAPKGMKVVEWSN